MPSESSSVVVIVVALAVVAVAVVVAAFLLFNINWQLADCFFLHEYVRMNPPL